MTTRTLETRRARRIYAHELARRIPGMTECRYRRIEHGRLRPTAAEAAAIEQELAAPPGSLFPPETITPAKWSRADSRRAEAVSNTRATRPRTHPRQQSPILDTNSTYAKTDTSGAEVIRP